MFTGTDSPGLSTGAIRHAQWVVLTLSLTLAACSGDGAGPEPGADAPADTFGDGDAPGAADRDVGGDSPTNDAADSDLERSDVDATTDQSSDPDTVDGADNRDADVAADASDADVDLGDIELPSEIPGPPGELASQHWPVLSALAPRDADFEIFESFAISRREVLVQVDESATVAETNALLAAHDALILGAIPGNLALLRLPTETLAELLQALQDLADEPLVVLALPEFGGLPEMVPAGSPADPNWIWDVPDVPAGPAADGNWGLELVRAPQMWNLDTFVRRRGTAFTVEVGVIDSGFTDGVRDGATVTSTHPDFSRADGSVLLEIRAPRGGLLGADDHGTFAAGIVGAAHDNGVGVAGIDPWVGGIRGRGFVLEIRSISTYARQLFEIAGLLRDFPAVRVVNNSYGLSNFYEDADDAHEPGVDASFDPTTIPFGEVDNQPDVDGNFFNDAFDPDLDGTADVVEFGRDTNGDGDNDSGIDLDGDGSFDTWQEVIDRLADAYAGVLSLDGLGRDDFLIVASAGNATFYPAELNSPFGSAEARHGVPFLTVENITWEDQINHDSSFGAGVSAPGSCVRSTEADDGDNTDPTACGARVQDAGGNVIIRQAPWVDSDDPLYGTGSGTSFSAPLVSGLASALWAIEPSLTSTQVHTLLTAEPYTLETDRGNRKIDAFGAAMGIDDLLGTDTLHRALLDVDDGTMDGNLRVLRDASGPGIEYDAVDTPDQRRGDGQISMADLRAYRDALTQVLFEEGVLIAGQVSLDGSATHFKRDLNFDGCVGTAAAAPSHPSGTVAPAADCAAAPAEGVFPRYDFNGDGQLIGNNVPPPVAVGQTDVEVLAAHWPDGDDELTEGWAGSDLDQLLPSSSGLGGSADLHIATDLPLGIGEELDEIRLSHPSAPMLPMTRVLTPDEPLLVWTVPLGDYDFTIEGYQGGAPVDTVLCFSDEVSSLKNGEDRYVDVVSCEDPCAGLVHTLATPPTNGDDSLFGTSGDDVILGLGGNDFIVGGGGNDIICGGPGNDTINGSGGIDTVHYGANPTGVSVNLNRVPGIACHGHPGGELCTLFDDETPDTCAGEQDSLTSIERIIGSPFGDRLVGNDSGLNQNNILEGRGGDDFLCGRGGDDVLIGGVGDDDLQGEAGIDLADFSASVNAVDVSLVRGDATGEGFDFLLTIENIRGSAFDDTLEGDDEANVIEGGAGADTLIGNGGNDTLYGALVSSPILAGDGGDTVDGGPGNDVLEGGLGEDDLDGGADSDLIRGGPGTDILRGGPGGDVISGDSIDGVAPIDLDPAEAGDDRIYGGDGGDNLSGDAGDDIIQGGDGQDIVDGDDGRDTLYGYFDPADPDFPAGDPVDDDDSLFGSRGSDILIDGGPGNDGILGDLPGCICTEDAVPTEATRCHGDDNLAGGDGNDSLFGGDGDDQLDGGEGDDLLRGNGGGDTLVGGPGDDELQGYATVQLCGTDAANFLFGGDGDDLLLGGPAVDELFGEADDDDIEAGAGDTIDAGDGDDCIDTNLLVPASCAPGAGCDGCSSMVECPDCEDYLPPEPATCPFPDGEVNNSESCYF